MVFGVHLGLSVVCVKFVGVFSAPFSLLAFQVPFYHITLSERKIWICLFKCPTWIIKQIKGRILVLLPQDHCHLCTCNSENENSGYLCFTFCLLDL